jgi:molecular chaperone DnaK
MVKIAVSFELGAECLLTVTARELNTGRQVQAVMSAREGPTAARRKLDDGLSKGATGAFPVSTTPGGGLPLPRKKAGGPFQRLLRKLLGRSEAR